jgi:hypothetical protein
MTSKKKFQAPREVFSLPSLQNVSFLHIIFGLETKHWLLSIFEQAAVRQVRQQGHNSNYQI